MFKVVKGVVSGIESNMRHLLTEHIPMGSKDSKPDRELTSLSENGYM